MISYKLVGLSLLTLGVVSTVYAGYSYIVKLTDTVEIQAKNISKLKTGLEIQSETIAAQASALDDWAVHAEKSQEAINALRMEISNAKKTRDDLEKLFASHDLSKLAFNKPRLIEKRINSGTARAIRMLECTSRIENTNCAETLK